MILRLEQVSRLPDRKHIVKAMDGTVVYSGGVPRATESYLELNGELITTSVENISTAGVCKNTVRIGQIVQKLQVTKKILFLPTGYDYFEVSLFGHVFQMYDIGLGANQHYVSICNEDRTVAVIHKDDRVINYLNTHTVYAENNNAMNVALICAMYLESTVFCDRSAGLGNGINDCPYYSAQKELRAKYDSTFIPRIKTMDGMLE